MKLKLLNVLARARDWKSFVQESIDAHANAIARLEERLERERLEHEERLREVAEVTTAAIDALENEAGTLAREREFVRRLVIAGGVGLGAAGKILTTVRNREAVVRLVRPDELQSLAGLGGVPARTLVEMVLAGDVDRIILRDGAEGTAATRSGDVLLDAIKNAPVVMLAWLDIREHTPTGVAASYFERLDAILHNIKDIDLYAWTGAIEQEKIAPPFDVPNQLPPLAAVEPRKNSALFLHNNYYHYNNMAEGLRSRGWDAVTVSVESPTSPQRQFYHGEDVNLFDADPDVMKNRIREFFRIIPERFGSIHFYGMGHASFFPENFENVEDPDKIPWDLLELRRHNLIIGYMPSGCLDGGLRSSIYGLSGGVCDRCVWQLRSDVCSEARSLAWNRKIYRICDWVGLEGDYATPERVNPRTVYGPVVTALDTTRWNPSLDVPDDMRIERAEDELLIYHAVGNYHERRTGDRDLKGTGAVIAAVERLKSEGHRIRLIFAHDVASTRVRFLQVQADVVVDQVNYGRYGANAREAMMLGRPTICRLVPDQAAPLPSLRAIQEVPLVNAGEADLYTALRGLIENPSIRRDLTRRSRAFAVAWHGSDACAERYEKVIDRLRLGLDPESPDLYPATLGSEAWLS